MNKSIIAAVVVVIIAVAGAGVYLMQNLDGIVKDLIEQVGTDTVGTKVSLADVKVNLREGSATLSGLTVANPPGYSDEPVLSMGTIHVAIDTASLTEAVTVINEISVSDVRVLAEQKGTGTNVQALRDGMDAADGDGAAADQSDTGSDILLAIKQINFDQGAMELRSEQYGSRELTLQSLKLRDLGSADNGLTPEQVGVEIAGQITRQVQDAVTEALKAYVQDQAESKLKEKLGELFKRK